MKITDYEVTPEGMEQYEEWGHKGPRLPSRSYALYEALGNVIFGTLRKESYGRTVGALPRLLERGFITGKSTSTHIILGRIQSLEVRRDLDIYKRMAEGGDVSDKEVDYLYNKSKDFIGRVDRGEIRALWGISKDSWKDILGTVNFSKSRGDKVIAIDTTMSLMHDGGGVSTMNFWKIDSEGEDAVEADRFLTRLFEGD